MYNKLSVHLFVCRLSPTPLRQRTVTSAPSKEQKLQQRTRPVSERQLAQLSTTSNIRTSFFQPLSTFQAFRYYYQCVTVKLDSNVSDEVFLRTSVNDHMHYSDKKAQLMPGKCVTAVCVRRLVFAISPLFDDPQLRNALRYQHNLYIAEKYIQCATVSSLTIRVYLHSFSCYCLQNM